MSTDKTVEQSVGEQKGQGISRRKFLQILGTTSAVGAVGCTDKSQQVLPFVKKQSDQIVGESVWYNSTCSECSAGCGIQVRAVDGRAIKIEGNPAHPVNQGGVCALGHSALQAHYDPDRIRQPLKRSGDKFAPVSWDEALAFVAGKLKDAGKAAAFIHRGRADTLNGLIAAWSESSGIRDVGFDPAHRGASAKAAELVFGVQGVPTYSFDDAQAILNFGADFLETWESPCEYARSWARNRKSKHPARFFHIEPRLSLTGANADLWLSNKPGSEANLARAVLAELVRLGRGESLSDEVRGQIAKLVAGVSLDAICAESGVARDKILSAVHYLNESKASLVLAGGAAAATSDPLPLLVTVNLINLVLGNVGTTVNIALLRPAAPGLTAMSKLIKSMKDDKVKLLLVDGTNPLFNLPSSFGFAEAMRMVGTVVSFASHMDETTALADIILPSSSALESWGDAHSVTGAYGLQQPTMLPVFDTRALGDIVMALAKQNGNESALGGQSDFLGYLKISWQKIHTDHGSGDFKRFWQECVERGGFFVKDRGAERVKVEVNPKAFNLNFGEAELSGKHNEDVVIYPFPSVRSFDGNSANRPWLSEIPDPISQVVWDSWAEINPDTAKAKGIQSGDIVTIRNFNGELNLPAYLTAHVHPGVVAIPIGHGHTGFGRFAQGIGGNIMKLLPADIAKGSGSLALVSAKAEILRGRGRSEMVNVQGSDSQLGRELAKSSVIPAAGAAMSEHGHGDAAHADNGHGEHHDVKQMYQQREHPLYHWGMVVDLNACTGCSACVVACYSENNIAITGKEGAKRGREMSWLRMERYYDGSAEELQVSFLPMMCQHCGNAPCEPVCPVFATYHNEEGMNVMTYNRCVGTRYCSNNCSYKVRRFNWYQYEFPEPMNWQLNPDVTPRNVGIMEKCTFCIQRINAGKDKAKDLGRVVQDGDIQPACVQSCPTQALSFGNFNDPNSQVSKLSKDTRAYKVLDHHINTQPSVVYLEDRRYKI